MADGGGQTQAGVEEAICGFFAADDGLTVPVEDLIGDSPVAIASILDSERLLELVTYVEDEYGVEIDDMEITPDNFGTVPAIAALVVAKLAADPAPSTT